MARGRTIARNSFFLALAHGASKLFSIGLTAIAGRVLGPGGYGFYAAGSALVEVGRAVASCGLDYLVAREVASDPAAASRVASNAATVKLLTAILGYAVLLGVVVGLDYPPQVLGVVLILGTALFFENQSDVIDAVFQGRERMEATTRALAVASLFLFVTGAAALWGGLGLVGYCWAFVVGFALRWAVLIWLAHRRGYASFHPRHVQRAELRRVARAGVPLLGATVITLLFHRVDLLMLGKLVDEGQVGLYGAAVRIIDVVVLVPRILATAIYPSLRRSRDVGRDETIALMGESTRITLVLCSAVALGVWALARLSLWLIPGPEFLPATGVLRLLAWGIVLQAGVHVVARLLFAIDAEIDFLRIGAGSLVCNVLLNLWWIPRYGIEGAAWATVCSYGVSLGLYLWHAARRGYPVPLRRALLRPGLALLAAAAVSSWMAARGELRMALLTVGTWLVALLLLRAVGPGDLRRARQLWRERKEPAA